MWIRMNYCRFDSVWIVALVLLKVRDCLLLTTRNEKEDGVYTNLWAVEIEDGHEKRIAKKYGFSFQGKIFSRFYLLRHDRVQRRSRISSNKYNTVLEKERHVTWFEQQLEHRIDYLKFPAFSNQKWEQQWYLNRNGSGNMNVEWPWQEKYTGKGVVISVVDDGVEANNAELRSNYDAAASYDAVADHPVVTTSLRGHGTMCAGVIAAASNELCGVGVAFNARIGGIRSSNGLVLIDAVLARAFSRTLNHTEIYSCSWGPPDEGDVAGQPGSLTRLALTNAITMGRNGLGAVVVFSGGNGGDFEDNCAYNGYVNSMYTIAINSVTQANDKPSYAEKCSAILACTYSSDKDRFVDYNVITTGNEGKCSNFSGTSASAAMASGIIALALQANKKLTWRDVQHLIVRTSRLQMLSRSLKDEWVHNKGGFWVSSYFGFGLLDAQALVKLAKTWKTVPKLTNCTFSQPHTKYSTIPSKGRLELNVLVNRSTCEINFLEHVQLQVNLYFHLRGHLEIFLTSPQRTRSILLPFREFDFKNDLKNWRLLSVQFWGENPNGRWNITFRNRNPKRNVKGKLFNWTLILTGTTSSPISGSTTSTPNFSKGVSTDLPTETKTEGTSVESKTGLTSVETTVISVSVSVGCVVIVVVVVVVVKKRKDRTTTQPISLNDCGTD